MFELGKTLEGLWLVANGLERRNRVEGERRRLALAGVNENLVGRPATAPRRAPSQSQGQGQSQSQSQTTGGTADMLDALLDGLNDTAATGVPALREATAPQLEDVLSDLGDTAAHDALAGFEFVDDETGVGQLPVRAPSVAERVPPASAADAVRAPSAAEPVRPPTLGDVAAPGRLPTLSDLQELIRRPPTLGDLLGRPVTRGDRDPSDERGRAPTMIDGPAAARSDTVHEQPLLPAEESPLAKCVLGEPAENDSPLADGSAVRPAPDNLPKAPPQQPVVTFAPGCVRRTARTRPPKPPPGRARKPSRTAPPPPPGRRERALRGDDLDATAQLAAIPRAATESR